MNPASGASGLPLDWFALYFLPPSALQAYNAALADAREMFNTVTVSAWGAYDAARDSKDPAATDAAWATYHKIIASARKTYCEAKAAALYRILNPESEE